MKEQGHGEKYHVYEMLADQIQTNPERGDCSGGSNINAQSPHSRISWAEFEPDVAPAKPLIAWYTLQTERHHRHLPQSWCHE
jgi:hypothetical protein